MSDMIKPASNKTAVPFREEAAAEVEGAEKTSTTDGNTSTSDTASRAEVERKFVELTKMVHEIFPAAVAEQEEYNKHDPEVRWEDLERNQDLIQGLVRYKELLDYIMQKAAEKEAAENDEGGEEKEEVAGKGEHDQEKAAVDKEKKE